MTMQRAQATKIKFDDDFRVDASTHAAILKILSDAGVAVGSRPMHVTAGGGPSDNHRVRVKTKTGFKEEVKLHANDEGEEKLCTIRFEASTISNRPSMEFARCPLFSDRSMGASMRRMVTVKEPRAKPKYTANGDVLLEKEISVIKAQQTTMKELGATLKTESAEFFEHAWVAHHQAQKFDECIDKLPADSVAILLDYSMNYPHEHMDQTQSEWWSSHQSTILPVISYYRDKHGNVWARSHVYAIETKESDSGPGTYHYYRFPQQHKHPVGICPRTRITRTRSCNTY